LHRLRGELLLASEADRSKPISSHLQSTAEKCFQKAVNLARRHKAKSLELRATMSLARLWWQQGKIKQAHKTLFEIYNWFTEGFDTKDLQEAKALLEDWGLELGD